MKIESVSNKERGWAVYLSLPANSEQFYSAPRSPGFPPVLGDLVLISHIPSPGSLQACS